MKLEWSIAAMIDLDRFATFLHQHHPQLANTVATEIIAKAEALLHHPRLGRPIAGHEQYREIVLRIVAADYVFQYRIEEDRIVILRVFHGRETRRKR